MKPGWNPTKRNRNIGTKKRGYSNTNLFWVPSNADAINLKTVKFQSVISINGTDICFVIDELNDGYSYSCSIEEIYKVLSLIPERDLEGLKFFILRQPTKKEETLRPCWGRFIYNLEFNKRTGAAIIIYAINIEKNVVWKNSLSPYELRELEMLRDEGHSITMDRNYIQISSNLDSAKTTQLYRTIFHEVGHLVHWIKFNKEQDSSENSSSETLDLYIKKPMGQKEEQANRYANQIRKNLLKKKLIPF